HAPNGNTCLVGLRRSLARYYLNFGRVTGVLEDPTVEVEAGALIDDIVRERDARKNAYGS
ncbi:MAG: hypothetical protein OXG51_08090, partial [Gammaproteobacteria bacterium]|nr:hypothetical protein [Gammaproteobacteria bacterium]